jgi:hypothetical protein
VADTHIVEVEDDKSNNDLGYRLFPNVYGQPGIKGIAACTFQKVKFSAWLFIRSIFWHHLTYSQNKVKCIPNARDLHIVRIGICKINDDIPSYGDEDQWTVIEIRFNNISVLM